MSGRLREITVLGTMRNWRYDCDAVIAEYDGTGALVRRTVPGVGTDEPIAWYKGSSTSDRRYLHADERDSVVALSVGSAGLA